ncbi:MAG: substrate-binding domain-containing protein [Bacteroidales bacterium]
MIPYGDSRRWIAESKYFGEKFEELGGEVILKVADRDEAKQFQQALELIEQGVQILVINSVNVNASASIVREAHKKGIKVVAYDRLIQNSDLDFFVTFDGVKVGEMIAKYMLELVPEGNYVVFNGDRGDDNAILFQQGILNVLKDKIEAKKINLVFSGYMDDWLGTNAAFYMEKILECSSMDVNAILSTYDGLSDGISEVLKKHGLSGKILITGQDAEIAACYRILNNEQVMTVYKPGKMLAYKCAEITMKLVKNEKLENIKTIHNGKTDVLSLVIDPVVIDKNNLESVVIADGFLTMDEILNYK